jgi:uncharacterized protein with PIN domain
MIVVDTAAIVAIASAEPEREAFVHAFSKREGPDPHGVSDLSAYGGPWATRATRCGAGG